MNDIPTLSTIVQGGVAVITVYLIWSWNRERSSNNTERAQERKMWYETVNLHMNHDIALHEKHVQALQKLIDVVKSLEKRIDTK